MRSSYTPTLLLLLAPALTGCPRPPVARPYPAPTAAELLAYLKARDAALPPLRTDARVDYLEGTAGDRVKLTMTFLVAPPGQVRVDAESPVGGATVASLATDGERFALLDARNNRFLVGPAAPCNLARLLHVHVGPRDLVSLVAGGAPLWGEPDAVSWKSSDGGRDVLTLKSSSGDGLRETIELAPRGGAPRPSGWDVVAVEVTAASDPAGKPRYRMQHEDFSDHGTLRLPGRTHLEEPARDIDVRIRWRDPEVGVTPPAGAFQLQPPDGITPEPVDCGGAG